MMVGEKEFLETMKEEGEDFAIVIRLKAGMTTSRVDDVPSEVQTLLKKYGEVVVDELPSSLLLIRDVNRHIDFILGASPPNKSAYKLTRK